MNITELSREVYDSIESLIQESSSEINGDLSYPNLAGNDCKFTLFFESIPYATIELDGEGNPITEPEIQTCDDYTYEWRNMISQKFSSPNSMIGGVSWGKAFIGVPCGLMKKKRYDIVTSNPNVNDIESLLSGLCGIVENGD